MLKFQLAVSANGEKPAQHAVDEEIWAENCAKKVLRQAKDLFFLSSMEKRKKKRQRNRNVYRSININ